MSLGLILIIILVIFLIGGFSGRFGLQLARGGPRQGAVTSFLFLAARRG